MVVYDSLASSSLLNEVRDDAELIFAGKRSSHHFKKQYETNQLLIDLAKEGKNVVRLKGGDPYIFGRDRSFAPLAWILWWCLAYPPLILCRPTAEFR